MERLYSVEEAAELLRVSPHTLRLWVYQGRLRATKLGRRTVFTEDQLSAFVEAGQKAGERYEQFNQA